MKRCKRNRRLNGLKGPLVLKFIVSARLVEDVTNLCLFFNCYLVNESWNFSTSFTCVQNQTTKTWRFKTLWHLLTWKLKAMSLNFVTSFYLFCFDSGILKLPGNCNFQFSKLIRQPCFEPTLVSFFLDWVAYQFFWFEPGPGISYIKTNENYYMWHLSASFLFSTVNFFSYL